MSMDRSVQLGQASIPRLLLRFSLPAIVGMMAQASYNLIDRVFVGHALGSEGIAGTTVAFPFMLVVLAFAMLIGFGGTALISIRLGEGKKTEAEQVLGNTAVLLVVASIFITAAGLLGLKRILVICGASDSVLPYARDYLRIIVLGTVFQMISFGLNAAIRGEGNLHALIAVVAGDDGVLQAVAKQDRGLRRRKTTSFDLNLAVVGLHEGFLLLAATAEIAVGQRDEALAMGDDVLNRRTPEVAVLKTHGAFAGGVDENLDGILPLEGHELTVGDEQPHRLDRIDHDTTVGGVGPDPT